MKTRLRPFFQQVQQLPHTIYKHLSTKPLPISNPLWEQAKAEAIAWEPVLTLEQQEASHSTPEEQQADAFLNSTPPKGEVLVRLLSTPPEQGEPWVTNAPRTPGEHEVQHTLMHIFDESVDIGLRETLLLPSIKTDKHFVRAVSTTQPDALRHINTTDPYLSSVRITPQEFAIVPRRATAQLPPRLGDDTIDSPEHIMPVELLVNGAIVAFHQEHQRLPHAITISYIRFLQHWINNPRHRHFFFYKTEYGDVEIPIVGACMGEFAVDEVRLD